MAELMQGIRVSPGVAIGPVHFKEDELDEDNPGQILANRVDEEMDRFSRAVRAADEELLELSRRHTDKLKREDAQILEVHRTYLKDPFFLNTVKKMVSQDLVKAESAIARVVADYERVMELVEDKSLQERAEDLRDVGLRVLRRMKADDVEVSGEEEKTLPDHPYVLAARRLSIADMFALDQELVLGILAEEGGVSGHAAIMARSMGIPAVTGLLDMADEINDGDLVILAATEAEVHIRPTDLEVREFRQTSPDLSATPTDEKQEARTADGEHVVLVGSCGSLADVDRCVKLGLEGIGVFRTEQLFMTSGLPTDEIARDHYREVIRRADSLPVTFRLLDTDRGSLGIEDVPEDRNPALGLRSLRTLLRHRDILCFQLRALLRAAVGGELHLLIPFVTLPSDLRTLKEVVKDVIFEEREKIEKEGGEVPEVYLGLCVEVPAVALALADFLPQVDFAVVALDDLAQYLLAADRDSMAVRSWYQSLHPALIRLVANIADLARQVGKPVGLFGESAAAEIRLPFYIGAGFRSFSISPVRIQSFRQALSLLDTVRCRDLASHLLTINSEREIRALLREEAK